MFFWEGKIGEAVVRYWPHEFVVTFGCSYVCANFGENDQEMRP